MGEIPASVSWPISEEYCPMSLVLFGMKLNAREYGGGRERRCVAWRREAVESLIMRRNQGNMSHPHQAY